MIELLNVAGAIETIGMGLLGLAFPKVAAKFVGLSWQTPEGQSEFRATYGGLWLPLGIVPIVTMAPIAFLIAGLCWLGAALGRVLSIILDRTNTRKNWVAVAFECVFAILLLAGSPFF